MQKINAIREGSYVKFTVEKEDGSKTDHICKDIRGAIVWPTIHSPAYYCIFAQMNDINLKAKLPLRFLTEYENPLPTQMFKQLLKDARRLECYEFYIDHKKENHDFVALLNDYCRYHRISRIALRKAPLVGKFYVGIKLLQEWVNDKGIEVHDDTTLKTQLKTIATVNLEEKPEEKFYAINAMQFLVGSVEKDPWTSSSVVIDEGRYQRSREMADPGGWT